ncbi:YraN family protein [Candidatus Berkelbacteria bacterium]|nr:YraN family protein [Candidatus Berkelbacteria bacterium]
MKRHLETGRTGEDQAASFLISIGYTILERNRRYSLGEIDILACDRDILVLVEVKTGRTGKYGYAFERVGPKKKQKLRLLARRLSQDFPRQQIRIDLIDVDPVTKKILHIPAAIDVVQ